MELQYPLDLLYRQRVLLNTVTGLDDHFTFRMVKVTAGVRHYSVTAAGNSAVFAVADD